MTDPSTHSNTYDNTHCILVVEDERKLASVVIDYLAKEHYKTHHIEDGNLVVPWVRDNSPSLILLDIMLPNKNGIEICREIRQFSDIPILMVTARVDEINRLLGLEIGADDYICKPFSPREVVARVKANLRRVDALTLAREQAIINNSNSEAPNNQDPLLRIDQKKMQAHLSGKVVDLTAVEFRLLEKMASHPGQIFSRAQLIDAAYQDNRIVSERTVDSHIKKLRKQLNEADPTSPIIQSVYGVGYKVELDSESWDKH